MARRRNARAAAPKKAVMAGLVAGADAAAILEAARAAPASVSSLVAERKKMFTGWGRLDGNR